MSRARGFSLMETLIVLVVMGAVVSIVLTMAQSDQKLNVRARLVEEQAREMIQLARASDDWLRAQSSGLPAAGTRIDVSIPTLVAAGNLPAGFAQRLPDPGAGNTPPVPVTTAVNALGQPYVVTSIQKAGITPAYFETLVIASGPVNPGLLARAGISNTTQDLAAFNNAVMREMRKRYKIPVGYIQAGSTLTDQTVSGFTIDVSAWQAAPPTGPTAAVFMSFMVLGTLGQVEAPAGEGVWA